MIKQIAWNAFKNTGDIDAFLVFKNIQGMEEDLEENKHENSENKWDNNSGEIHSRF